MVVDCDKGMTIHVQIRDVIRFYLLRHFCPMTVWDSAAMGISLGFEYGYRIWDYHVHHRAIPGIYNQQY